MGRTAIFTIRHDPERSSPWWISIPPKLSKDGKRQKRFFRTKTEAEGEVQRLKVRKENHGTAAKLLDPADERQAATALRLLRENGITLQLSEVVGDYVARWKDHNASVPLSRVFEEYLQSLKKNHRSQVHRKSIENVRDRFSFLGEKLVADLKPLHIEKGLEGTAPSYRNAILVRIRSVLNYGMRGGRKWLAYNPANDCELIRRKLGEVKIYTVKEIEAILTATAQLHPELLPAVALMTFAGIRPDHKDGEITKLSWDHLILNDRDRRIELPSTITKLGKRRSIKIRPALTSWLDWHREQGGSNEGLVCPCKGQPLRTRLRAIYTAAKLQRIQDGLRHSFASYLVPIDGADIVEAELGHRGGREMLSRHYRSDVRAAVAKKFWSTRAPKKSK